MTSHWQVPNRQTTLLWLVLVECGYFMKIPRWSCDQWLTNLWRVFVSCYYFVKCRKSSIYDLVNTLWRFHNNLMRSRAVIWHSGDYFVASFWWRLTTLWRLKSHLGRLADDSVKIFDQKWQRYDSYRVVLWWHRDYVETSIYEGTTIQQFYDNPTNHHMTTFWPYCDMRQHNNNSLHWKHKIINLTNL